MWRHVCNVPIKPGTLQTCRHLLLRLLSSTCANLAGRKFDVSLRFSAPECGRGLLERAEKKRGCQKSKPPIFPDFPRLRPSEKRHKSSLGSTPIPSGDVASDCGLEKKSRAGGAKDSS